MDSQKRAMPKNEDEQLEAELVYDKNTESENADQQKLLKLKKQLAECRQQKEEYLTGWQRAQADFVNYRRRQEEQMKEWQKLINEKLIMDLMPILDSLEQGSQIEGIRLIKEQLQQILKNYGLDKIKSVGEKFDPQIHEAIESTESTDREEGVILEELQAGYTLNGKLIKPAKVKVTKHITHNT